MNVLVSSFGSEENSDVSGARVVCFVVFCCGVRGTVEGWERGVDVR